MQSPLKILLTGGGGFVGLNITEALLRAGHHVVVLENAQLPSHALATFSALPGQLHVIEADVSSSEAVTAAFNEARPDRVIHAAAITPAPERELREYGRIIDVNIKGAANVLRAALEYKVARFVYVSSGSAYGAALFGNAPLQEDESVPLPDSLYAITKFAAERLCLRMREQHGLDAVCARLGSVFGPWEFDTGVRDTLSLPLQILRRATRGDEIVHARNEPRRDWVYSRDVAAGIIELIRAPQLQHTLYHLSSGFAWGGISAAWCGRLQAQFTQLKWRPAREGEIANVSFLGERSRTLMSIERLTADTAYRPAFTGEHAFADYFDWVREHAGHFYARSPQGRQP